MVRKQGFSNLSLLAQTLSLYSQNKSEVINLNPSQNDSFESKACRQSEEDAEKSSSENTPRVFQPKILINKTS